MRTESARLLGGGRSRFASALLVLVLHLGAAFLSARHAAEAQQKAPSSRADIYLPADFEIADRGFGGDITCRRWYVGIGVEVRFDGRVIRVARGYPAERAGLMVGDEINPRFQIHDGMAVVPLTRGGASSIIRIPVEKICVS